MYVFHAGYIMYILWLDHVYTMDAIFILSSSHNIMYTDYVHIHCPVGHRGDVNEMSRIEYADRKNLPRRGIYMYFML